MSAITLASRRATVSLAVPRGPALPAAVAFVALLPVFNRLIETGDHGPHIGIALQIPAGAPVPPHPLFHVALLALVGWHGSVAAPGAAAMLLALTVGARAWLTARMLEEEVRPLGVLVLTLLLAVAMPLPNWWGGDLLLGQPSPNVWHNPTLLLAVPFALAAFRYGVRLLDEPQPGLAAATGAALALGALAKPNFALAFVPVFGPMLTTALWRARDWRKGLAVALLAFAPVAVVLAAQALWLRSERLIFLEPLAVWRQHSRCVWGSVLVGAAFPLAVAACFPRRTNDDPAMKLAWLTFGVATATFAMLVEGHRPEEANFGWGLHLAAPVLYVATAAFLLRQPSGWRRWLCLAVLVAQAISGVGYLAGCLSAGRF